MPAPANMLAFTMTHWSVVLEAGVNDTKARNALGTLYTTYWSPVYCYLRGRGHDPNTAKDLTQGFFARMIERGSFRKAQPDRGKFRGFLLAALKNFLTDEHNRDMAEKRGGGWRLVSFDANDAEAKYRREPVDYETPDILFDRRWAQTLIDKSLERLTQEFAEEGKAEQFQELRHFIVAGAEPRTYAEVARHLGMAEDALKKVVLRLRRRYSEIVRREVSHTLAPGADIDEEIRYLCSCLGQ